MKQHNGNSSPGTVISTGKGVAAILLGSLRDQGLFDYDDKVAKYWPEFAQCGKENITIT
jgi:CubicO group peptidase (beta-lactamase class C family)